MKTFRDEFPTLNHLLRRFKLTNELAWPMPEEIETALQDYCVAAPADLQRALTLYERDYDSRSATTFRQALYRLYAILCGLPKFKEAYPKPQDLINRIGVPTGSLWPSPDILQSRIEEKCFTHLHTLQQALTLYGKVYRMELTMSFPEAINKVHEILSHE